MTSPHPTPETVPQHQPPRRMRRALLIIVVAVAAGMTGAFASSAFSQGFGPHWHARPFWGQRFDPATFEDRADRMTRHLAVEIDATPEQQDRLRAIVRSTVRELVPMREKMMAFRQRGRELLMQTTIDRAAIETLRSEQMALADQASRRLSQGIADAASVLSVEQRRKLADRMERWRAARGIGWRHG
jgi:periplasmic protein CpxP/Spy